VRYQFSLLLYRIVSLVLLPILFFALLYRSINNKAYRQRISERFGLMPKKLKSGGIIVHAASVGEVIALKSFVEQLLIALPNTPITVTTFTPTGSAQVKKLFPERVQHCYLPIDSTLCVASFLNKLKPKALVVMETEIWPNLINQCSIRDIKLLLINGRLSTKSLKSYQKLSWLVTPTLNLFDKILCQSEVNYQHFLSLGAELKRCTVSGNVKFDMTINESVKTKQQELANYLVEPRTIFLIASTHDGDEAIAISAFKKMLANLPTLLMVIVPRHPERFGDVALLCESAKLNVVRRSEQKVVSIKDQVWLLDSLGELMAAYALADVVTMGGSFNNIGGHNPLEPALFKKPIIVGPNMSNFTEVFEQLLTEQGIIQLTGDNLPSDLASVVLKLVEDNEQRLALGENAYRVVMKNQGASKHTVKKLMNLLEP
jgi:3-deoxy-D-manno-octulosonic-acid transferase